MRNITVAISDDTYRRARIWAAERNGSISAIVQYLLETLPGIRRSALAFPVASTKTDPPPQKKAENTSETVKGHPTNAKSATSRRLSHRGT
jgi:hypothetical protein